MRDGIRLAVHLHRPSAPGRYPAILTYTPYRLGLLGAPPPIVREGYVHAAFDIRGTGNSEGWNDSIYSAPERQDGYDMVEWLAAQPWCTGAVGMWGISFGAVVAIQTAMAAPPHLKAIIARSGSDDPFTEWTNPGGLVRPYHYTNYGPLMSALNFAPPNPEVVGKQWMRIWRQRLSHNLPWGISFARHLHDGPFWRERALRGKYDQVRCAVFVVDGWADWYHSPLLRIYQKIRVPKRALIGPWSHQWPDTALPGPRIDWHRESLRWFDQHLKGKDTGICREPPVTFFIREFTTPRPLLIEERGQFRSALDWPPPGTGRVPYYLAAANRLSSGSLPASRKAGADRHTFDPRIGAATGMHGGGPFNDNWAMPLDQRTETDLCLSYTSPPLTKDCHVIGWPTARLYVSTTARNTALCVRLCDVAPDGTTALVTKGWQNVAYRTSCSKPAAVKPGKVYEVEVPLLSCAWRYRRGHRIRIMIASSDFCNVWPLPEPCVNTIYYSRIRPSCILLPVTPRDNALGSARHLKPSPAALPAASDMTPPLLEITDDTTRLRRTVHHVVRYSADFGNEAWCTVDAGNPGRTEVRATGDWSGRCDGKDIRVFADTRTASDARRFRHNVEITATVDGRRYFARNWSTSVPRRMA